MKDVAVGNGESHISIYNLDQTMQQNQTSYAILADAWRTFGRCLDIDDIKLLSLERKLKDGYVQIEAVIYELLGIWKAAKGTKATVSVICAALIRTGIQDIADCLQEKFCSNTHSTSKISDVPASANVPSFVVIQVVEERWTWWEILASMTDCFKRPEPNHSRTTLEMPRIPKEMKPGSLGWIPQCSILHVVANRGDFRTLKDLIKDCQESSNLQLLLHACVSNSNTDDEDVIQSKLKIIELLCRKNEQGVKETLDECTPLLQRNVHIKLLEALVERGASVNECSDTWGTILHRSGDEDTFEFLLQWAVSNGFNQMNFKDSKRGLTPLLHAIKTFETLSETAVETFKENGADFNAKDPSGNPVLFHALLKSESPKVIEKIVDCGADVNVSSVGPEKINAAHLLCKYADCKTSLDKLISLERKGFHLLNQKSGDGKTPLECISDNQLQNEEVREFVVSLTKKKTIRDVLIAALKNCKPVSELNDIIDNGGDVNCKTGEGDNLAHLIVKSYVTNKLSCNQAIKIFEFLSSKGFKLFNKKNNSHEFPLSFSLLSGNSNPSLTEFFQRYMQIHDWVELLSCILSNSPTFLKFETASQVVTYKDEYDGNVAHKMLIYARGHRWDIPSVISSLKILEYVGFSKFGEKNIYGVTPLHISMELSKKNFSELLDFFEMLGVRFDIVDVNGVSVLHRAILCRHSFNTIKRIRNSVQVAQTNFAKSVTPYYLHLAAREAHVNALRCFDDQDVNETDEDGNTPLHMLFYNDTVNYIPSLKHLLKRGAKLAVINRTGNTPVKQWISYGRFGKVHVPSFLECDYLFQTDNSGTRSELVNLVTELLKHQNLVTFAKQKAILLHALQTCFPDNSVAKLIPEYAAVVKSGSKPNISSTNHDNMEQLLDISDFSTLTRVLHSLVKLGKYEVFLEFCELLSEVIKSSSVSKTGSVIYHTQKLRKNFASAEKF